MPDPTKQPTDTYIIKPSKGLVSLDIAELLLRFKELLYAFVWRNVKVRYKQTAIGVLWAVLQPLLTMLIFTIFFGRLAKLPSDNIPYPVFVYVGLLYWNFFSTALSAASSSLIDSAGMIQKIYFPRLLMPISAVLTPVIDFFIALLILFCLMFFYHYTPHLIGVALVPAYILIAMIATAGIGFFFAALNVKYRDVRYALPFIIQTLLFLTPVIYPVSIIPARFQWIAYLNPMAGVITAARSSITAGTVPWGALGASLLVSVIFFLFGLAYFKKTERFFADII